MCFIYKSVLLVLVSLLMASCGTDKNFGDGKGLTSGVELKAALRQVMDETSVLATSLKREDDSPIENARVSLSFTQGPFTLLADETISNDLGLAGNSVSALTYAFSVTELPSGVGLISRARSVRVKGTSSDKFRSSMATQEVTGDGLSSLQVDYFRSSSSGVALDFTQPVLSLNIDTIGEVSTLVEAELFSGLYRARVQAQTNNGVSPLITQLTKTFTVVGNGVDAAQLSPVLSAEAKTLTLNLRDNNGLAIQGQANGNSAANDVRIIVYDMNSTIEVARAQVDVNGQAVISIYQDSDTDTSNDINSLFAVIADFSSASNVALDAALDLPNVILGVYQNAEFLLDDTQTLSQSLITGQLQLPSASSLDGSDSANINVAINDLPLGFLNKFNQLESIASDNGSAVFELALFNGNYTVNASGVLGFPAQVEQVIDVADASVSVVIPVDIGGQLSGLITDQANAPLSGVLVSVHKTSSLNSVASAAIAQMITAVDGRYRFDLAAGDYDLWVNGAVTENISITQSQTSEKNIKRFSVSGSAVDIDNKSVEGMQVFVVQGDSTVLTNGNFSINVFEGLNAICYRPPATRVSLGLECHFKVEVNQLAIDSL